MPTRLPRRALAAVTVLSLLVPLIGSPSVVRGAGVVDQALRRYPYLSDAVGPYVTINWATDRSATTASVRYGPVGSCSQTSAAATRTTITVAAQTEYQWRTELTLQPDTAYCYRVFLGSVDLLGTDPAPTFRTQVAAGSGGAFSFAVFGDWGSVDDNSNNSNQANLMSQIAASGARFAVTTGDTGYQSGSQTVYGDLVQTGHDTSAIFGPSFWTVPGRSIPLFNTQGNHGFTGTPLTNWPQSRAVALSGGRYLSEQYCCTNGTLAATYPSQWYAFDAGNSRFYVLTAAWSDGNNGTAAPYRNDYDNHWTPSSAEYVWLKHDLETHAGTHKFAFFHYPLYSDNPTENSNLYLRGSGSLEGLLAQHGVDMAFNGHAHLYQRNLPPNGGIVTYVTGGGGATPEPIGPCTPTDAYGIGWSNSKSKGSSCGGASAPTAIAQVYHFLLVTVNGDAVTVAPTDSTGRQFDVMTYRADTEPPTAPTGLTATANGSTRVDLTWTAASDNLGVTGYEVYRDGTQVATVGTVTAYGDSGLAPGTAYSYTVRARDAAGNRSPTSAPAAVTTGATIPTAPPAPSGLAASAGDARVNLAWNAVSAADSYSVKRATSSGGPFATIATALTATAYADTTVANGTTYWYVVSAVNGGGESANSNSASATPTGAPPPPPPPPSQPIFSDDFESGTLSSWNSSGGLTVQSTLAHQGTWAVRGATTTGRTYAKKYLPATYNEGYFRIWFYLGSGSPSQVNLMRYRTSTDGSIAYLYVATDGTLGLRSDAGGTTVPGSTAVATDAWHSLEMHAAVNGGSGSVEVWLDGGLVNDLSSGSINLGTSPIGRIQIGEVQSGRTYDVTFDDVAFATSRIGP